MPLLKRIKWVFNPEKFEHLIFTHAQVPTPYVMSDRVRVFISGRVGKISHVFTVDITHPPNCEIISISKAPIFSPNNNMGTFDDEGVMPSCFVRSGDDILFLYSGWNSRNTVPYHNSTGIARYHPLENTMERLYDGPILERNYLHPYLAVTPSVWEADGQYSALYISGLSWLKGVDRYEPLYVIKKANSKNLLDWDRPASQFVPSNHDFECFSNPAVKVRDQGEVDVIFCSRNAFDFRDNPNNSYKMGYAKVKDDIVTRGEIGWGGNSETPMEDSMQCYPAFFLWDGVYYVLYNGNGFGKTGFGIAEYVEDGVSNVK